MRRTRTHGSAEDNPLGTADYSIVQEREHGCSPCESTGGAAGEVCAPSATVGRRPLLPRVRISASALRRRAAISRARLAIRSVDTSGWVRGSAGPRARRSRLGSSAMTSADRHLSSRGRGRQCTPRQALGQRLARLDSAGRLPRSPRMLFSRCYGQTQRPGDGPHPAHPCRARRPAAIAVPRACTLIRLG